MQTHVACMKKENSAAAISSLTVKMTFDIALLYGEASSLMKR